MNFVKSLFNSRFNKSGDSFYREIKKIIGFKPGDLSIYEKAFTHSSVNQTDNKGNSISYERLEFLGDSILGAIIATYLFKKVPSGSEGYLTQMRSKVVSREHLNELGRDLNLLKLIKTNVPKNHFGPNIYGNVFEALVGAIFLDKGFAQCEKFIHKRVIKPYVDIKKLEGKITSYKSLIIEWCQKNKKQYDYETYEDTGKDKVKHFAVRIKINQKTIAKARETSKKKAEERASKRAYYKLQKEISHSQLKTES